MIKKKKYIVRGYGSKLMGYIGKYYRYSSLFGKNQGFGRWLTPYSWLTGLSVTRNTDTKTKEEWAQNNFFEMLDNVRLGFENNRMLIKISLDWPSFSDLPALSSASASCFWVISNWSKTTDNFSSSAKNNNRNSLTQKFKDWIMKLG